MAIKFFYCPVCGNVVVKMVDSGVVPHCCGDEMEELIPHARDEFSDKHLPVFTIEQCVMLDEQDEECAQIDKDRESPCPVIRLFASAKSKNNCSSKRSCKASDDTCTNGESCPTDHPHGSIVHVKIGEEPHPMTLEHHIIFIALETNLGVHVFRLRQGVPAVADFTLLPDERPLSVYSYCNIHSLWGAPIK